VAVSSARPSMADASEVRRQARRASSGGRGVSGSGSMSTIREEEVGHATGGGGIDSCMVATPAARAGL
jgi:hypothetical protein